MRVLIFTATALLLFASAPQAAAGTCCDDHKCRASAVCCKHHAGDVALDPMGTGLGVVAPGLEWPTETRRPVREYAKVVFRDPVRIGDRVLIGTYVIEHDNDRMAQGRPCTHIYAANDLRLPLVAFHCRHLDRKANPRATVTVRRTQDPSMRIFQLTEFQFEGST